MSTSFSAMLKTATATAAAMALGLLSSPAMAGEFFSGSRSSSSQFDSTRVSTGTESVRANRKYQSEIKGYSNKRFVSASFSADNLRAGGRGYTFTEGSISGQADLLSTGDGDFDISAGGGGSPSGGGGQGEFENNGSVAGAGSLGGDIASMGGSGGESYVTGSFDFSAERGRSDISFKQSERGDSVYSMNGDFASVNTESGSKSSGGSVYSLN